MPYNFVMEGHKFKPVGKCPSSLPSCQLFRDGNKLLPMLPEPHESWIVRHGDRTFGMKCLFCMSYPNFDTKCSMRMGSLRRSRFFDSSNLRLSPCRDIHRSVKNFLPRIIQLWKALRIPSRSPGICPRFEH